MNITHIKTLKFHLNHWKHLNAEHICEEKEGRETIEALQAAIEALQTEPCDDAISRREVMDIIHHYKNDRDSQLSDLTDGVCNLPSVQPEQRWIHVSERLPEEAYGCVVTVEEDDRYGEPQRVIYPDFVGYDGKTWNDASGEQIPFEVIAWMPLPEPWKKVSE